MDVISSFTARFERSREEELSLEDYLAECKRNPLAYATAAERMLKAIGEPKTVDTRNDSRLSRLFANKVIKVYPAFAEFYGMEDAIEQVVTLLPPCGAGPGREEADPLSAGSGGRRQEQHRRTAEAADAGRALLCHQGLAGQRVAAGPVRRGRRRADPRIGIRHSAPLPEPHPQPLGREAARRIRRRHPQVQGRQASPQHPQAGRRSAKTEPGDENNQDISSLVGKVDIRKLETYAQDDPDAYSYSGGLCLANQGLLEFVEMFKAPIKVLHPLLTATQEANFKGTEGFGAIPFDGIVLAHSNESEWKTFRNNKNNEAFLDRIYIVKVPYCLRVSEEVKIYEKLLRGSSLAQATCAPGTLKMMSQFAILTRLKEPENSSLYSKMLVYDGENLKDTDPRAKSYQEYRDYAGVDEGMSGVSTRFAFKIISKVFNFDSTEVAANPVHLMYVLEQQIQREQFPPELEQKYTAFIKEHLGVRYAEFIGKEIQTAYLESYSEYGQNIFDRYVTYADYWIQDHEYRDTDTGEVFDRGSLNANWRRSKSPPASPTRRTSATRSSTSCCARGPTTPATTRCGPATRSCAR